MATPAIPHGLRTDPVTGQWWVRSQELADVVLRDPHFGMSPAPERAGGEPPGPDAVPTAAQFFDLWYRRGANHPTFKHELRAAYNAGAVAPFEAGFQALARERALALPAEGDLVEAFIAPYCLDTTFALMGFPRERWPSLAKAYHVVMFAIRQRFRGVRDLTERQRAAFESTVVFLRAATAELVEAGATPLARAFRAQALAEGEVPWADAATIGQLLAAGVPQVDTGLAVAARALVTEPGVLERVRGGELEVEQVAEEAMRLHPPFLAVFAWVAEPCDCLGVRLEPGTPVVVDVAAVNADPSRVPDPASFCPVRGKGANYTFGKGAHYCLGAGSARVQIAAGLRGLLATGRVLSVDASGLRLDSDGYSQTARALPYTLR